MSFFQKFFKKIHNSPESVIIDLHNFEKEQYLGSGSFSEVYKIKEKQTNKIYAAKISTRK